MKNLKTILIAICTFTFITLNAQSLSVKANVSDNQGNKLSSNFLLRSDDKKVNIGRASKVKLELAENHLYSLTFSRPGYKTKTINFSTFEIKNQEIYFEFDIVLDELVGEKLDTDAKGVIVAEVFYDIKNNVLSFRKTIN